MSQNQIKTEIDLYLQNRDLFYLFMLRKDYFLPDISMSGVSIPFMNDVFTGVCYLPKQSEINPAILAAPPTKEIAKE